MIRKRSTVSDEHALEFLLAFDGRIHHLEQGFWLKFEIKRTRPTAERPHGLRYSFTLHDPNGKRLVGFDNAHAAPRIGARYGKSEIVHDHWHRTANDEGRPYRFTSVDQLLVAFEAEVIRVLDQLGIDSAVLGESGFKERRAQ